MEQKTSIQFIWENMEFSGLIEKEYENSYLITVTNPSDEIRTKYNNRMIVSKKKCTAK